MNRLVLVARLHDDVREKAEELVEAGPPFDPARVGMTRHYVFLSDEEVVFVFEGPDVEWTVDDLIDHPLVSAAMHPWRKLVTGMPRIAREVYTWERESAGTLLA